ncbi:MAG: hypothetical protein JXQ87_18755 [Bacteroidia bacterium]
MFNIKLFFSVTILAFLSCKSTIPEIANTTEKSPIPDDVQEKTFPTTIAEIALPEGFTRISSSPFAKHLLSLPLKAKNSKVLLHNGEEKWHQDAQYAVIDLPIGKRDLHQCADAVMRVRADYLRSEKRYKDLHFNFTNGFNCEYTKWIDGYRIRVNGNNVNWIKTESFGDSEANYWKYLEMVWSYAGTLSLEKELFKKDAKDILPGDVWIKGGSPGHAIMVMDVARNDDGEKIFLLAQSYMPAQEMHVLLNPDVNDLSPWYRVPDGDLVTPEWTFSKEQLRTWNN